MICVDIQEKGWLTENSHPSTEGNASGARLHNWEGANQARKSGGKEEVGSEAKPDFRLSRRPDVFTNTARVENNRHSKKGSPVLTLRRGDMRRKTRHVRKTPSL